MESARTDTTIMTAKRTTTLLVSLLVALCSGTNYVRNLTHRVRNTRELKSFDLIRFTPVRSAKVELMHGESSCG